MLYAVDTQNNKIGAYTKGKALCPWCNKIMIAKCGEIKIHHWAHKSLSNCPLCKGETEWHLLWKKQFPKKWVEVPIWKYGIKHIADVLLPNGIVLEFQHSPISSKEIREREMFYDRMVWIFDVKKDYGIGKLKFDFESREGLSYNIIWTRQKQYAQETRQPVYLDVGDYRLFYLRKYYEWNDDYYDYKKRYYYYGFFYNKIECLSLIMKLKKNANTRHISTWTGSVIKPDKDRDDDYIMEHCNNKYTRWLLFQKIKNMEDK